MQLAEEKLFFAKPTYIQNPGGAYEVKCGLQGLANVLQKKRARLELEKGRPNPDQQLIARLEVSIARLENTLNTAALVHGTVTHTR